ncbi:hypothetical protein [Clostridium oceanicum]|uniref:Uncharacterized protein n=1 Tax=Clostridium oceanicum TaxID=1543 RepID=A0ABP3UGK8_9CLOT
MLSCKDKKILQNKLENFYCKQCDICICNFVCCKDAATNICDCCVKPLEDILQQLKNILPSNTQLDIRFTNSSGVEVVIADIVSINDGIINVNNTDFISICNISRIAWSGEEGIDQIKLLPPVCTCGECDCCERPLREILTKIPSGTDISIKYIGQQDSEISRKTTLIKTGFGILLAEDTDRKEPEVYSICKLLKVDTVV